MKFFFVVLSLVILAGCDVQAMSQVELKPDPCGAFLGRTWTVHEHLQQGGHSPSDAELIAPVGAKFTLTALPAIVVLETPNGDLDTLQEFWSSFNGDLECNVSYKNGISFDRLEARGMVSTHGGEPHAHYFTMISQICHSGKRVDTSWITTERPAIEPKPGAGSSSLCPGHSVYPNLGSVAVPKLHNGRWH